MKFAVEMSSHTVKAYAKVHTAGCKDLKDPEPFEAGTTRAAITQGVQDATGWDDDGFSFAPCVRKVMTTS
jgi:hypothetical protein